MNILINCSNLRFGGGITVGFNIIKYYKENFSKHTIFLVAPERCGYEQFNGCNTELIILPAKYNRSLFKAYLNYFLLPQYVKRFQADFLISLGNIAIPVEKPQILLIMFPYLAYPESEVWNRLSPFAKFKKNRIVKTIKRNAKYADVIFVQTDTMKQRLSKQLPLLKKRIKIIPCAVSFTSKISTKKETPIKNSNGISLLLLSKYYIHKNFEILIPLAKKILERNLTITITITLNEEENKGSALFLEKIRNNNLAGIIKNVGNIKLEDIPATYAAHDGLILPTLLESFSGTYIESFYFTKPIFTSDLDFARDSCKNAAFFFDPLDADNILKTIIDAFKNPGLIQQKVSLGKQYLNEYKTWDDIGIIFKQEMNNISDGKL